MVGRFKINRFRVRLFMFCLAVVFCFLSSSCLSHNDDDGQKLPGSEKALPDEAAAVIPDYQSVEDSVYVTAAENERFVFSYCPETCAVMVFDKANSYSWSSSLDLRKHDIRISDVWRRNACSLFNITYIIKQTSNNLKNEAMLLLEPLVWQMAVPNGVDFQFYFKELGLGFVLELRLTETGLDVVIPYESLREDSDASLVAIQLFPFLTSAQNGIMGYYLIPDGNGALMDLSKTTRASARYNWSAYSSEIQSLDVYEKLDSETDKFSENVTNSYSSNMPVYGAIFEGAGVFAYAYQSEEEFSSVLITSGSGVAVNRLFGEFLFNHNYEVSIDSGKKDNGGNPIFTVYQLADSKISPYDRAMKLIFYEGENAHYSEMANDYREHLFSDGKPSEVLKDAPLVLDILMSVREKNSIGSVITMADFDQVINMLDGLYKEDAGRLIVNLKGWYPGGYGHYPNKLKILRSLGGKAGLKKLLQFCEGKAITVNLETNFTDLYSEAGSFLVRGYAVKNAEDEIITNAGGDRYIQSPVHAQKRLESFLDFLKDFNGVGIKLERIGEVLPQDYNSNTFSFRCDSVSLYQKMIETAVSNTKSIVGVGGANLYSAVYADIVYGMPMQASLFCSDIPIPFYSSVLHGNVAYVSTAYNRFYDQNYQWMKTLEYGALPYFILTAEPSSALLKSSSNTLFSTMFDMWEDTIKRIFDEYGLLSSICSAKMIRHSIPMQNTAVVEYDNGVKLRFNYTNEVQTIEGEQVAPQSYSIEGLS